MNTPEPSNPLQSPLDIRRQRLASAGHYLTAFVLALKAVTYLGHVPIPWFFVGLCIGASAVVAWVTLMHHKIEARFASAQGLIYLAEAAVCAVLAFHTHAEGKVGLPYAWALAAAILLARGAWVLVGRGDKGGTKRPAAC